MNKTRRIGALLAATVAATGMAVTATTAPAAAASQHGKTKGPEPVSQVLGSFDERETEFVKVKFRTDEKACHFKLSVKGAHQVKITNPGERKYTSLNSDDKLSLGETDYAGFWVRTPEVKEYAVVVPLKGTISYDTCGTKPVKKTKKAVFLLAIHDENWG